jgi:hypothetical protein
MTPAPLRMEVLRVVWQVQDRIEASNTEILRDMHETTKQQDRLEQDQRSQTPKVNRLEAREYRAALFAMQESLREVYISRVNMLFAMDAMLKTAKHHEPTQAHLDMARQVLEYINP